MNQLEAELYRLLISNVALTSLLSNPKAVYAYTAPENEPLPIVVFYQQSVIPTYTFKGRVMNECLYGVKAITQGDSMKDASAIDDAIDTLLTDANLNVSGGTLYCNRDSSIPPFTEILEGVRYNHAGGSYRIWTGV